MMIRKRYFIGSILGLLLFVSTSVWAENQIETKKQIQQEIFQSIRLFEESLASRQKMIESYNRFHIKSSKKQPLSGKDLQELSAGTSTFLKQRKKLYKLALKYEKEINATPKNQTSKDIQLAKVSLSLASTLIMYDNWMLAISQYQNDSLLRFHLNNPDSGYDIGYRELGKVASSFASKRKRDRVKNAINWYEEHKNDAVDFENYNYLSTLIINSPSYEMIQKNNTSKLFTTKIKKTTYDVYDAGKTVKNETINLVSLLFGNTVGMVSTRKGKLYNNRKILKSKSNLEAGDILLEKTPFRLTDRFIPGHWGHAALWVGNEKELKALGIWNDPAIVPYHRAIRNGKNIIEALREGVVINSMKHFLNIDDLAVIRDKKLTDDAKKEIILNTFRQLGKAYDFNFDANSCDKVYCSKLVYMAYGDIPWPTSRTLDRFVVNPDDIASYALKDDNFKIMMLYHDGKEIKNNKKIAMEKFLDKKSMLQAFTNK
ncbi:MAG: YiiX/YebB-like N1pC/P60 family cysteine hydrolase [Sulfurovaceae bacterium]